MPLQAALCKPPPVTRHTVDRLSPATSRSGFSKPQLRGINLPLPYTRAFREFCDLYDRLCGIAVAVSATGHSDMMTTPLPMPIRAPGFNMGTGPAHGPSELVTMMRTAGEEKVASWTAKWIAARERFDKDPDANLDDLILQFSHEADRYL